jgi:hypothetical protein
MTLSRKSSGHDRQLALKSNPVWQVEGHMPLTVGHFFSGISGLKEERKDRFPPLSNSQSICSLSSLQGCLVCIITSLRSYYSSLCMPSCILPLWSLTILLNTVTSITGPPDHFFLFRNRVSRNYPTLSLLNWSPFLITHAPPDKPHSLPFPEPALALLCPLFQWPAPLD